MWINYYLLPIKDYRVLCDGPRLNYGSCIFGRRQIYIPEASSNLYLSIALASKVVNMAEKQPTRGLISAQMMNHFSQIIAKDS